MLVICSGTPTENLEELFLTMGEPAAERALPVPVPPDPDRLAELCEPARIELL